MNTFLNAIRNCLRGSFLVLALIISIIATILLDARDLRSPANAKTDMPPASVAPWHDPSWTPSATVPGLHTRQLDIGDLAGGGTTRVGVLEPTIPAVADVLFIHGHADRLDNHRALFTSLAQRGMRVISYDLPSHGKSHLAPIDRWSIDDLTELTARVEHATHTKHPLILSGWSFGGFIATRIAQEPTRLHRFSRPIRALILETPAVAPLPFVGGDGIARARTLTHDTDAPVAAPPTPASPFYNPLFATRLLTEATIAAAHPLPAGLPTLIIGSDPEHDRYIDAKKVATWATGIAKKTGANITFRTCHGARHGVDIEAWPTGPAANHHITNFIAKTLTLATAATRTSNSTPTPTEVTTACR
ncbi:alpha/beta hydrolase [Dermatophilus congolensis]|uniref:alpha/beta hydrolase n=1 Tax=Dermatophilus congolensis TaxID=1863 RepID=UPI001AAEDB8A|nr:alpha/beta fold hydrolase [Dermatophilus congolensis]MBO3130525.1 alpha/beta hydrolase [Dermatophilus congolensis]MBO3130845.1 alpha/beta hydrolase [Dermatophilus congolensis]MBO3134997.1 alpha/beta hydrolase [Dermatophilus congolensis]MBO3137236.1 alpha/beta hydrolase [Dermatophilus congolensis]MBO3139481.1 alpha/beta hydrolase [Dermatophilus congolensis]